LQIGGKVTVFLHAQEQAESAGELAVEAHFVADDIDAGGEGGQAESADHVIPAGGFGFVGTVVGLIGIGANDGAVRNVETEVGVDVLKVAGDFGGFGAGDAAEAPEAIGDPADEALLEKAGRFEFDNEGGKEPIVFGGAFFEVGRIDDDIMGVEAVPDGIVSDALFALGGFGAGGLFGVGAIDLDAILSGIFGHTVPLI